MTDTKGKVYRYCKECNAKIDAPVNFLGSESEFCEKCELSEFEGISNHPAS
jgi:hypothetical protein